MEFLLDDDEIKIVLPQYHPAKNRIQFAFFIDAEKLWHQFHNELIRLMRTATLWYQQVATLWSHYQPLSF